MGNLLQKMYLSGKQLDETTIPGAPGRTKRRRTVFSVRRGAIKGKCTFLF